MFLTRYHMQTLNLFNLANPKLNGVFEFIYRTESFTLKVTVLLIGDQRAIYM